MIDFRAATPVFLSDATANQTSCTGKFSIMMDLTSTNQYFHTRECGFAYNNGKTNIIISNAIRTDAKDNAYTNSSNSDNVPMAIYRLIYIK